MGFQEDSAAVTRKTLPSLLKRLKNLRQEQGLTQERFAELAGFSYKYYQQIETGRKPDLRLSTLERLAAAYGLEAWELLLPQEQFPKTVSARIRRSRS